MIRFSLTLAAIIFATTQFSVASEVNSEELFAKNCKLCHGVDSGRVNAPILFGQMPEYLTNSLLEYKAGRRDHPLSVMGRITKQLSEAQLKQLANYIAYKDPCSVKIDIEVNDEFKRRFSRGKDIAQQVNCSHCHDSADYPTPILYGQKYNYLKSTLLKFKNGKRTAPAMNEIAAALSLDDIRNLSTYLNGTRLAFCKEEK